MSKGKEETTKQPQRVMRHGPGRRGKVEKAKDPWKALKRLLGYIGTYKGLIALVIIVTSVSTILSLVAPYFIGETIDNYIIPRDWNGVVRMSLIISGIYVVAALADIAVGWIMATMSQKVLKKMRKDLFEHLQTLSLNFFDSSSSGDLMSRLTNDIEAIGTVLSNSIKDMTQSSLIIVGVIIAMFLLNKWLALASLLIFPIMVALTSYVGKKARGSFRDLQQNMGRLNGVMQETITGQKKVISFWQQDQVINKFKKSNYKVKEAGTKAETYVMTIRPVMGILSNVNIAIVAAVGGWMVLKGLATIGTISIFIAYSRKFADPMRQFSNIYNTLQSALAGSERVFEVLDIEPEIEDSPDALPVESFQGNVSFKEVEFSYVPDVKVIKNMDFHADPGQIIAIVGPTGAGKTTMVNILSRFYDIQEGEISIDDRNIIKYKKHDLRRQLGVVLQDVFLFSGSVMDNIRYGRLDATDEEVIEAAKLANADNFIRRLPNGYDTDLSERAGNLSQGQRQLLSIARALLVDPSILILDEATSSVDTRTEIQIQEALNRLMEGRTSFVIAHRLSTIRNADKVLVVRDGEIIERGTHKELMEKRDFYYNLYMSQFKGTIDDVDFEYIKPVEVYEEPQQTRRPGGGMGAGRSPEMMRQRAMEIINIFKDKEAISPESAKSIEELVLPRFFSRIMENRLGPLGIIVEKEGRFYLVEDNVKKL